MESRVMVADAERAPIRARAPRPGAPCGRPARRRRPPAGPPPKRADLSPKQAATLEFVKRFLREHGLGPTRNEIAQALGLKYKSTADVHLSALVRKGWVELKVNSPRYIRLLDDEVPVVMTGRIETAENMLDHARVVDQVPRAVAEWFDPCPDFFVELHDESMCGAGLQRGDLIAMEATSDADRGEIVVAQWKGAVVLRHVAHVDEAHVELSIGRAGDREALHVERAQVRIEGVMIGALVGRRHAENATESASVAPTRAGGAEGAPGRA